MSFLINEAKANGLSEVLREEAYYSFRSKRGIAYASFDGLTIVKLEAIEGISLAVSWVLCHGKAYLNNAVELKSTRYWVK